MEKDPYRMLGDKLLSEQLNWYRQQRHDFLNHWQVVMGYLQLKEGDKALAYLREVTGHQAAEQRVGQIPQPYVAATLMGLIIRLRQEEIPCELELAEELKQESFWQKPRREGYAEALYGYTTECLALGRSFSSEYSPLRAKIVLSVEKGKLNVSFGLYQEKDAGGPQGESVLERVELF